ncbi:MAG: hypothetical protein JXR49_06300 [Acidobacteria bacterium]|nr:hypothetical protein [Acidobacteriota bacterium]
MKDLLCKLSGIQVDFQKHFTAGQEGKIEEFEHVCFFNRLAPIAGSDLGLVIEGVTRYWIRYDEEYVRTCKELDDKRKIENRYGPLLSLFKWIIGFLPSRLKSFIEEKFGVPSRNASFISIVIELYLFFLIGFMLLIFTFAGFHANSLWLSVPFLIRCVMILAPDLVMRYDSYFRGDASPLGLFEWYFNFLCRIPRIPLRKNVTR